MQNLELPKSWPVACHTDNVGPGTIFVAVCGQQQDGLKFVELALQKGATKIVIEQTSNNLSIQLLVASYGADLELVNNARKALSNLSAQAWGHPANKLKIIGVTGTKGKTTSVYALRHLLAENGKQVAMITGVENMIGVQKVSANLTTPQPDYLHMFLAQCVLANIQYVVMEVSAQALSLHRVDDLYFAGVIFTNLELEHSEFYSDIETYFKAKLKIFKQLNPDGFVILNYDDSWVPKILDMVDFEAGHKIIIFSKEYLTYKKDILNFYQLSFGKLNLLAGLVFDLNKSQAANLEKETYFAPNLAGVYNIYNLAGVVLVGKMLGLSCKQINLALTTFVSAPGRLQIYRLPNGARGVVDYAHTPSSFQSVLSMLRQETIHLIVVFGAGGGRDSFKRPIMGQVATRFCDLVILTNDNPRQEDPQLIIKQIMGEQAVNNFLIEQDRALAIRLAYKLSTPDSIIVLLGKGPDEYQMIGDQKYFFSDKQELLSCS